ncbi:MAG TPA: family 16 glycoside hydrolase [Candidatus Aquilonibacter sp.]|nr:family 16 glycoside hydrolase [Candidatus Aquilonibacter sp.]
MSGKVWAFAFAVLLCASTAFSQNDKWLPNDVKRPIPTVVTPGATAAEAPSDAIVLFDGKDFSNWAGADGGAPKWKLQDGVMEVVPHTGNIHTKQAFGDCQLHVEWKEPYPAVGTDQNRGNSGIMLMSSYEVQVLDMDGNHTYADGGAGAIYGQYPPLVTASRKSNDWQTYDIIFRRPRFDENGYLVSPARITVIQNGVLVQDNTMPTGPTAFHDRPPYLPGPDKYPLTLQEHNGAVQYRNIWIRELPDPVPALHYSADAPMDLSPSELAEYAGTYKIDDNSSIVVEVSGKGLMTRRQFTGRGGRGGRGSTPETTQAADAAAMPMPILVPINEDSFVAEWSGNASRVTFTRDPKHQITGLTMQNGDEFEFAKRSDQSDPATASQ